MEDDERTGQPQMIRTEGKIEEVAMSVHANHSLTVDNLVAAVGISHGTCHKILSDDLNVMMWICISVHYVVQHLDSAFVYT